MNTLHQDPSYTGDVMAGRPPSKEATGFGKRIAAARQACGLTQQQLADRVGVSRKMIDYYERRAVNIQTEALKKLAEALRVSADELLGIETPKQKPGRRSKLRQQIEQAERLPRGEQQFISKLLDSVLQKASA